MQSLFVRIKRFFRIMALGSAVAIFVAILFVVGIFSPLENKVYDSQVRAAPTIIKSIFPASDCFAPSDDIVLVLINQDTLTWAQETFGWSWPWPREAYSRYLDFIQQGKPATTVFDILYTEPSAYGTADDEHFAQSLCNAENTVLPVFFTSTDGVSDDWGQIESGIGFLLTGFEPLLDSLNVSARGMRALFPVSSLATAAGQLGNITSIVSDDGIIRSASLFYQFKGINVPSLSAACLCLSGYDNTLTFDEKRSQIDWDRITIPVDKKGEALLRFKGELDNYVPYSMKDVLESSIAIENGGEPFLVPEDFTDKYVFTFLYGPGLYDICYTPISSNYPGAGIHITMLDNLLKGDFIRRIPTGFAVLLIIVFALIASVAILHLQKMTDAILLFVGCIVLIIIGGFTGYVLGWWVPVVAPLIATIVTFSCGVMLKYFTEGKQKRYIKTAFRQYLSPVVIEQLIEHPERLKLGGERREISIFFSDIQGFTSISEKLDPEQLTEFLNVYLSSMSDIILKSGGTIDKYEGDAIIAFWNAPAEQSDHAARALATAMECLRIQEEMQPQFMAMTGKTVKTRIGLNTGYAVVGNMGSRDRFDYTMIGDAVNLAARLEGLNKQFGTYVMCSESMLNAACKTAGESRFTCRRLASVSVVGRIDPVIVLEPIQEADWDAMKSIVSVFEHGCDLFYSGKFDDARSVFSTIADYDEPAARYIAECDYYITNPTDWQGHWIARSK